MQVPYNTPILPVANPYTLLTKLQSDWVWFSVLDLKDAFCLPLAKNSQEIFAFEWENPKTGRKSQLTWTVLPQAPRYLEVSYHKELEAWTLPPGEGTLLQYVDDLLVATRTREDCKN